MDIPRRLSPLLTVIALLFAPGRAAAAPASSANQQPHTLYICGDSTAARDRPPIIGWGEMIGQFFDPARLRVENHAMGGRSARTFIEEGRWAAVSSRLRPGDFVILQFGHNDSMNSMDVARYDLSGTGNEVEPGTNSHTGAPTEIHTYGYYLREMIDGAKAHGANVIVLSPVPRAMWAGSKIARGEQEHGPWAQQVAQAAGVPFVNANEIIARIFDPIGHARLKELYFPIDNTHTNPIGARLNAACILTGLAALDLPALNGALRPDALATARQVIADVPQQAAALKLTLPLARAFPAAGAVNVCPDTPLRLTFFFPPTLGHAGRIHIVDAATGADVDTIDVSSRTAYQTIGGEPGYRYYPVILSGRQATIYPRNGALKYHHTYYVTIDRGVFSDGSDAYAALDRSGGWSFTTKASGPAPGTTHLTVAADGTGDFCTVQGALDFIPDGNQTPTTIFIRKGLYTEMVFFAHKDNVTLRGEDRAQTVIAYATNDRFNSVRGNPFGSTVPNPSAARVGSHHIYHRGVFLAQRVRNLVLTNLTIRNTTPQGGSQAEAIILNGTPDAHAILKDVNLYSYQDTLQINGQAYLNGCYIEGDVDFMWGTGPCFFQDCTCHSLRSGAYYTQIRNPGTNHGYVYDHCTFDGAPGIMGNFLSRIGTGRFPHSEVVLLDCTMTTAVGPVAWKLLGGHEGNPHDIAGVHFWEYNSHDPAGQPVDTTFRMPGSRRLTEPADATTIANYRNPAYVLGDGWNPLTAPVFAHPPATVAAPEPRAGAPRILVPPRSHLALLGTGTTLSVSATGNAGRITYQWWRNGEPVDGATSPTLRINRVGWDDAAVYTVVARNTAGEVTSAPARLTAVAPQASPAPALPQIPAETFDATSYGAVADGATDNAAAIQRAIDTAAGAGGGIVVLPAAPRPYLCGPLVLRSQVNLEIATGAVLQLLPYSADPRPGAYPLRGHAYPNFITAVGAHDIALTGGGVINGNGDAWWAAFRANRRMPHRPFLVRLTRCDRVLVDGLTFTRSPMFHLAIGADNLTVFGITVNTPEAPNTDGVDPAGSHQLIQNCVISDGDDNVVMKPGGQYCSDITVADCAFGRGHGMSVGGQSNRGLDGLTVKNCSFDGTTSGLRLKADPTQGGPVRNVTYTNLTMQHVLYPIVFYSYYSKVGNPAAVSGRNLTTPERVRAWNDAPPYSLATRTMPSWRDITVANLLATGSRGHSIIWGLPRPGYLIENVRLENVRIAGGRGFEVYNAAGVQFTGDSNVGRVIAANALALLQTPRGRTVAPGATVGFTVAATDRAATYQWSRDGHPLADGPAAGGATISGATTPSLTLSHVTAGEAGKYAVTVTGHLDGYSPERRALEPGAIPASVVSAPAVLRVSGGR